MGKYAVLVGCNYPGTRAELNGCCNDTDLMKSIVKSKGFRDEDIMVLRDDSNQYQTPNYSNFRDALRWLCSNRSSDDALFVSFSGHGTQIPSDGDDEESDNYDEALVLSGFYLFADDDFKECFAHLSSEVKLTVVCDCCHSGTMLDHSEVPIKGDKSQSRSFGSKNASDKDKKRSLPIGTVAEVLSETLKRPVPVTEVRTALADIYGDQAGKITKDRKREHKGGGGFTPESASQSPSADVAADPRFLFLLPFLPGLMQLIGQRGFTPGAGTTGAGTTGDSRFFGFPGPFGMGSPPFWPQPQQGSRGLAPESTSVPGVGALPLPGQSPSADVTADPRFLQALLPLIPSLLPMIPDLMQLILGQKGFTPGGGTRQFSGGDRGILVTGCQSNEYSYDCPFGSKYYGALSKTMHDQYFANKNCTHMDLVKAIRSNIRTPQNPCLECKREVANTPFIC